ncbi:MAG: hypothetical protein IT379_15050 [Deltaproteobacteria bacterium]|nr:hypothetical protein [Deltaproteobacteria bacterium]
MSTPPSATPPPSAYLIGLALVFACDSPEAKGACEALGVCEAPRPPPEDFTILCDATPGSTCGAMALDEALHAVLVRAVTRPGSAIHVWNVSDNAAEVARATIPEPPRRVRSAERHRAQEVERLRRELREAATPAISAGAELRRSPVARTVTRIARSTVARGVRRHLVILSDLRELTTPGGLDLECPRRLPSLDRIAAYLAPRSLLPAGSLAGRSVTIIARELPRIPTRRRCELSLRRLDELVAVWTSVLEGAGASVSVRPEPGADMFDAGDTHPGDNGTMTAEAAGTSRGSR